MNRIEDQTTQYFNGLSIAQESIAKNLAKICQELGVAVRYDIIRRQAIAQSLETANGRKIKGYVLARDKEIKDGIVNYQRMDCSMNPGGLLSDEEVERAIRGQYKLQTYPDGTQYVQMRVWVVYS